MYLYLNLREKVYLTPALVRAPQGDSQWSLKMVEIPTSLVSPQSIVTEAVPTYCWQFPLRSAAEIASKWRFYQFFVFGNNL